MSMTPAQFKLARQSLGLTQSALAPLVGRQLRNVQQWEAGERAIDPAAVLLVAIYQGGYRPDNWPGDHPSTPGAGSGIAS